MTPSRLDEWEAVAQRFGVEITQVARDHLISHILAAIARALGTDDVVFIGGTALSRTHLSEARLSEDVDLVALAPRSHVAAQLERALIRDLARSHGQVRWQPLLSQTRGSEPATMTVDGEVSVQIQLTEGDGFGWPTEEADIEQRYADAPPARLRTLRSESFGAAKLAAWIDRRAARDLYDLWALAERNLIGAGSREAFARHGQFGRTIPRWVFEDGIDETVWRRALGHQTRLTVTAAEALDAVRGAWLVDG